MATRDEASIRHIIGTMDYLFILQNAIVTPTEVNKNPVTPMAYVSVKSCILETNVTNAKADTTKVSVFANLALVTPTEVDKNLATPAANVAANKDMKESNVTNAKADTIDLAVLAREKVSGLE